MSEIDGKEIKVELTNRELYEKYKGCEVVTEHGSAFTAIDYNNWADNGLYACGAYFPVEFLTDARIAEFKETNAKLFASWRR